MTRKIYYLGFMPFLFCVNIMVTLSWFNTTIILALAVLCVVILHISDGGQHFQGLNDFVKRKFHVAFPDIFETGVMPMGRFWLIVVPCILAMLVNIPLSNYAR